MKKRTPKQYAEALYEVTSDVSDKQVGDVLDAFVRLLARDRMMKKGDAIVAEFLKKSKKEAGIVDLEVTTVRKADEEILQKLKSLFGKESEIMEKVDKSLLGGLIVRTEGKILDASIKTQLELLNQKIS